MRKIYLVFICLIFAILTVIAGTLNVLAQDAPVKVAVEVSASTALSTEDVLIAPGETFDVSIVISENPGVAGMVFSLTYDATQVQPIVENEIISFEMGDVFTTTPTSKVTVNGSNGKINFSSGFVYGVTQNSDATGIVATFHFEALSECEAEVQLNVTANQIVCINDLGNVETNPVEVTVGDAVVYIHEFDQGITVDATCTEQGYTVFSCTNCDFELITNYVDALGHTPGQEATCTEAQKCTVCGTVLEEALGHDLQNVEAKAPTCTEIGWNAYQKCSRCDYSTYEELAATGHTPGAAATCTTPQTCTVCGTVLVEAIGHDLILVEGKDPTCTEIGWIAYDRCSRCDYSEYVELPAKGHEPGAPATCTTAQTCTVCGAELAQALGHDLVHVEAKAATESEIGWNAYDYCTRCDYSTKVEIPAIGHEYEQSIIPPTCTEKGYTLNKCKTCDSSYISDYVPALGHAPGSAATCETPQVCTVCGQIIIEALGHDILQVPAKAPTCTTIGWYAYQKCTRCSYTTYVELPATGHIPGAAATCTEAQKCTVCGITLAQALGHDLQNVEAKAPTCTEIGWNAYQKCSRCDYSTYAELAATGHTPGAAATCTEAQKCTVCGTVLVEALGHDLQNVEAKAPTCTEIGWNAYQKCSRCDYSTYAELAATGHTPGAAATCTEAQKCTVCGTVLAEALGHDLQNVEAKAPTCTEIGWNAYQKCSRCDYSTYAELAATGHTPGAAATCTEAQKCTVCGTVLAEALGHDLQNVDAQAPTCVAIGWNAYQKCSRCDYSTYEELSATGEHTYTVSQVINGDLPVTCVPHDVTTINTCSVCGDEKRDTVSAVDPAKHTGETEIRNAKEAAEGVEGYTGDTYCKGCGAQLSTGTTIPALPTKSNGGRAWIWIAVGCGVLIAAAVVILLVIRKKKK